MLPFLELVYSDTSLKSRICFQWNPDPLRARPLRGSRLLIAYAPQHVAGSMQDPPFGLFLSGNVVPSVSLRSVRALVFEPMFFSC